ncbi:hypothetical protein D3C76_1315050 [compost metagenome]
MQQIAVGTVQFDQVETGFTSIGDRLTEIVNDARDLVQLQRARSGGVDADRMAVFITQGGAGARIEGRSRNRSLAARLDAAVRDTTGVPQLDRDATLFGMHAVGDLLPRRDLFRAVQARGTSIAFCLGGNLGGFRDDQARADALAIVFTHQRRWNIARLDAAQTGKGCHKDTVGCNDRAHFKRGE